MSEEKTGSGPEMGPKTTTPQKTTAVLQNHPPPTYAEWAAAMQVLGHFSCRRSYFDFYTKTIQFPF